MRALALAAALLAGPALAQEPPPDGPLDGPAFEALVEGRTLAYGAEGAAVPRGIETYAPGRRVTWLFVETGECLEGRWFEGGTKAAPQICFQYEDDPTPHCFLYERQGEVVLSTNPDGSAPEVSRLDLDQDGIACAYLGV